MLKLRGSFEGLVIQDLHSAESSDLDMLLKHTSPPCLAREDRPCYSLAKNVPNFFQLCDRV